MLGATSNMENRCRRRRSEINFFREETMVTFFREEAMMASPQSLTDTLIKATGQEDEIQQTVLGV